ncbi:MAG: acyl carrier protein [Opitutales bacterium]|nr:acyl carrier protein [Opitutales bacterium]
MTLSADASDADPLIQKLAAYPETLRELVLAFRSNPNDATVDAVVCGILRYHAQDTFDEVHATHGDGMSLFDDLSMDSLTMTEIAFEAEDFLDIILSNEDMLSIKTLADLKAFVRKAASRTPDASAS